MPRGTYKRTDEHRARSRAIMRAVNLRQWQDLVYREAKISAMSARMIGNRCAVGPHKGGRGRPGASNPNYKGGPIDPNGPGWKAARRKVWERDKVCQACGGPPSKKRRLDVHHIVPRREGGTNDEDNLLGMHHGCHMKVEFNNSAEGWPSGLWRLSRKQLGESHAGSNPAPSARPK